jgi:hypothetical protein
MKTIQQLHLVQHRDHVEVSVLTVDSTAKSLFGVPQRAEPATLKAPSVKAALKMILEQCP